MDIIDRRLIQALHVERLRRAGLDHTEHVPHVIFQASTIDALLDGAYDGDLTFAELNEHGDFGIGTLEQLDGEMIALDGAFFVARSDGRVDPVSPDTRTPFAVVIFFQAVSTYAIESAASYAELQTRLYALAPKEAACCAVRVDAQFAQMRVRSVPRQTPPYPPLPQVTAHQAEFNLGATHGTLVGFCFPDYAQGFEVAGYHLHYLSQDRTQGGHVLDCVMEKGIARFDASSDLHIEVPSGLAVSEPDSSGQKRQVLRRVEGH
ncbi:MAG: acetolactate decarboxylase [Anaerolineae bacterium]